MKKWLIVTLLVCSCIVLMSCDKKCEHQYQEQIVIEAKCSTPGVKSWVCILCEHSYTEEIPPIEHTYTEIVSKEATCVEEGLKTYSCSQCDSSYTENIPTGNHIIGEAIIAVQPTCTATGERVFNCTACGQTGITETIAKIPHDYAESITQQPTCTHSGVSSLTCRSCGNQKSENIAKLGHNYKLSSTQNATCKNEGAKTFTCSRCKDAYKEVLPLVDHAWIEATCSKAKHCSNCGVTSGDVLPHIEMYALSSPATCEESGLTRGTYCDACGIVLVPQQVIPAKGHNWRKDIAYFEPTCMNGYRNTYHCKTCYASETREDPPIKHTTDDGRCDLCDNLIETRTIGNCTITYARTAVETRYNSAGKVSRTKVSAPYFELTYDEASDMVTMDVLISYQRISGAYLWFHAYLVNENGDQIYIGDAHHIDKSGNSFASYAYDAIVKVPAGNWKIVIDDTSSY